jgi:iduronate 2-sulfatase
MFKKIKYQTGVMIGIMTLQGCVPMQAMETFSGPEKPNILFIAIDDLRPELGSYGNSVIQSPVIDQLASEGVMFTRAYCNVPVCGASRASLLTGARPTKYRFLNHSSRADRDYPEAVTLPEHFRNNGYYTIVMGKVFHLIYDSPKSWNERWMTEWEGSWRDYLDEENISIDAMDNTIGPAYECMEVPDSAYKDGENAIKAIRALNQLKDQDQPFFLAVGFVKPHLPFNAPKKYWDLYDPDEIGLAPNPFPSINAPGQAFHNFGELRAYHGIPTGRDPIPDDLALTLRHGYYACVSYVDAQVGLILQALEEMKLADNTIVVLWGDHGYNLGEHDLWAKHCNFNTSLHSPLIFKVPGLTKGDQNHSITEFIDIYPTLSELSGLPLPGHLDGKSLVSRLVNPEIIEEDYAVSKYQKGLTLIEQQYFYTEWYDENDQVVTRMLYDHSVDPDENENISENPEYNTLIKELSRKLKERRGADFFSPTEN